MVTKPGNDLACQGVVALTGVENYGDVIGICLIRFVSGNPAVYSHVTSHIYGCVLGHF